MKQIPERQSYCNARIIGVVYLLYFLTSFFSMFLIRGLVVGGDSAATANNILAHETMYRSWFTVGLIANAIYIAVTALFYRLFAPVNRTLSLIAAFFSLVGCTIQIFGGMFQLAPLVVLRDAQGLSTFGPEQLQVASVLSLKMYSQTFNVSLVLFALYDLVLGLLIFRSTFLPRILGVLLMVAGVGWLTFLWPPLAAALSSFVLPLGALAEIVLMLWLIVKGVDVSAWQSATSTQ